MSQLRLPPLPTVRDLIKLYRLRALKQLSQNFLLDTRINDKIVRAAGGARLAGAEVCEVGPGPGPITRSILNAGVRKLTVIEKDERFLPTLQMLSEAAPGRLVILIGDVLSVDLSRMFCDSLRRAWEEAPPSVHIVGNLPFSVSTPLIIRWLRDISERRSAWSYGRVPLTLTFQQEVAERIVAREGDPQRCRLSVMCQAWSHPSLKFTIPGSAFVPKPDVDVGVVHLVPRVRPAVQVPFQVLEKVARNVFSFRQKFCRRGIETLFPEVLRQKMTSELISRSEVDPESRPFELRLLEFARLAENYWKMCHVEPKLFSYNHRATLSERGEDEEWQSAL